MLLQEVINGTENEAGPEPWDRRGPAAGVGPLHSPKDSFIRLFISPFPLTDTSPSSRKTNPLPYHTAPRETPFWSLRPPSAKLRLARPRSKQQFGEYSYLLRSAISYVALRRESGREETLMRRRVCFRKRQEP